jgi:hypothetical protein
MEIVTILTILILVCFLFVVAKHLSASQSDTNAKKGIAPSRHQKKARPGRRSPFRATSITCNGNACSAVQSFLNVRFLDLDNVLPAIPVRRCNIGHCNTPLLYRLNFANDTARHGNVCIGKENRRE